MSETTPELQFEQAEPSEAEATQDVQCVGCGQALSSYFEVNGRVACERCKDKLLASRSASHVPGLLRASALGALAAALGAGIYYAVSEITGYEFGLMSIVLGLMVGFAVKRGSKGRGGWRYQALAMFLCYASICSTYVPRVIAAVRKERSAKAAASTAQPPNSAPVAQSSVAAGEAATPAAAPAPRQRPSAAAALKGLGLFAFFTLALPFLAGAQNLMGIVIIGIGLYEAWKVNRAPPFSMSGPFAVGVAGK